MASSAASTPRVVLETLTALSADLLGGVVLGFDGSRLAGPEALHAPAHDLIEALDPGAWTAVRATAPAGLILAARDRGHAGVVLVSGSLAALEPGRLDLALALGDLGSATRPWGPAALVDIGLAVALLRAARSPDTPLEFRKVRGNHAA